MWAQAKKALAVGASLRQRRSDRRIGDPVLPAVEEAGRSARRPVRFQVQAASRWCPESRRWGAGAAAARPFANVVTGPFPTAPCRRIRRSEAMEKNDIREYSESQ